MKIPQYGALRDESGCTGCPTKGHQKLAAPEFASKLPLHEFDCVIVAIVGVLKYDSFLLKLSQSTKSLKWVHILT